MLTCLTLLSFLLVFIFGFFTQLSTSQKKVQKAKNWVIEKQLFQIRVNQALHSLNPEKPLLFTTMSGEKNNPCLCFEYDNNLDPDPNFSGRLKGKLMLDQNQLTLQLLSKDQKNIRKEALLHKIISWEPSFLVFGKEGLCWKKELPKKDLTCPLAIKITCQNEKKETFTYAFFSCLQHSSISYDKAAL